MASNENGNPLAPTIFLLLSAIVGFVCSNSMFSDGYYKFLDTLITFQIGGKDLFNKSVLLFINDGLMAIFFLFVGLELKRELLVGELSDIRKASLPIIAAIGGMLVPALIYMVFNTSGDAKSGWGIPMATDIAFALGIVTVLGSRVPRSLKVILTAIAIVDDLGAILVIALFYTSQIGMGYLLAAFVSYMACLYLNFKGVLKLSVYMLVGVPLWYFMLKSGIHATIAGVMLAFAIPLAPKDKNRHSLIEDIFNKKTSPVDSPAVFLEKSLVKWVSYLIIPLFAFANSGVAINSISFGTITLGVILGLVLGKPLGIVGFSMFAKKRGWVRLPADINFKHLVGMGAVAGIGFTMSLFIGSLAFKEAASYDEAKVAIIIGSICSSIIGVYVLLSNKTIPYQSVESEDVVTKDNSKVG